MKLDALFRTLATAAAITFLLADESPAAPIEQIAVRRADDTSITAYVERSPVELKQSILLIVQGSQCMSVASGGADRMKFEVPKGMARLDIEKYSIDVSVNGDDRKSCPPAYLANNAIHQRVGDLLAVVAYLRLSASWWNGRLYLIGTSEGATVAAMAGPLIVETKGIVLINGSIGRPFREGWAEAMVASVAKGGGDSKAQQETRAEVEAVWTRARLEPRSDVQEFGVGNTLKWWASIIDLRPSNQLLLTNAPILLMQADQDEMTPVSSARSVSEQFRLAGRQNLTYIELPGLSHGLRKPDGTPGWQAVLTQVGDWLEVKDRR